LPLTKVGANNMSPSQEVPYGEIGARR
jgi:hypothetical protein